MFWRVCTNIVIDHLWVDDCSTIVNSAGSKSVNLRWETRQQIILFQKKPGHGVFYVLQCTLEGGALRELQGTS